MNEKVELEQIKEIKDLHPRSEFFKKEFINSLPIKDQRAIQKAKEKRNRRKERNIKNDIL